MALIKNLLDEEVSLPDPEGPLTADVSIECMKGANKKVSSILNDYQLNKH